VKITDQPDHPDQVEQIWPINLTIIPVTGKTISNPILTKSGDPLRIQREVAITTMILISFINPVDLEWWQVLMTSRMVVAPELLCVMNVRKTPDPETQIRLIKDYLSGVVNQCHCLCPSLLIKCWPIKFTTRPRPI
jgi:hypothetical protein